jgi:hypothetical protein
MRHLIAVDFNENGSLCYVGMSGGLSNGRYNGAGGNACQFFSESYGNFWTYGYVANAQSSCSVYTVQPGVAYNMLTTVVWESDTSFVWYIFWNAAVLN